MEYSLRQGDNSDPWVWYRVLLIISTVLMAVTIYAVFLWVPTEVNLGVSQRIFYVHVPLAWLGMISIVIVAVCAFVYLVTGNSKWDSMAYVSAELGVIFASLILVTGVIWAKGDLGWWWTWDAKLTTTLVLWFIYVGYLMIRSYSPQGTQGTRIASVVALFGAIDAPIIYMATVWWRTAHPELNVGPIAEDSDSIGSSRIYITLLISTITFTILYIHLLILRYTIKKMEVEIDEIYQSIG